MGKAYLVARREYLENVRTKTFWIGIFMIPLIWSLAILLVTLFQDSKDIRKYAVIDKSGWLFDAVENETAGPNLTKVFDEYDPSDSESELTAILASDHWQAVLKLPKGQRRVFAKGWRLLDKLPPEQLEQALAMLPGDPSKLLGQLERTREELFRWWRGLPTKDRQRLAADRSSSLFERVDVGPDVTEEELRKRLDREELFAFFVIHDDPVGTAGKRERAGKYVSNNRTDRDLRKWFERHANRIVQGKRLEALTDKISRAEARWLTADLRFDEKKVDAGGNEAKVEKKDIAGQSAPVAFVIVLWISVMVIVQMLITNMIEEKSNRIIEVLLSSVSPLQLMTGKILGLAATGFSIVLSWGIFLFLGIKLLPLIYPKVGTAIVEFGIEAILGNPVYVTSFVVYFVLGYLLYAVVIAGVGSVFNSLKEAQNVISPIMIVMMIPYLASFMIIRDPNGTLATVMSYIPPFTPFVMMGRAAGPPPTIDYVITTAMLVVTIAVSFYLAAKIFRIGILMTGKPPKFREILRWLKAPVGAIPQTEAD